MDLPWFECQELLDALHFLRCLNWLVWWNIDSAWVSIAEWWLALIGYSVRLNRLVGQKYAWCAANVMVLLKKGRTPLGAWLGPAIGGVKMQGVDIYSKGWRQASTNSVADKHPTWSLSWWIDWSFPSEIPMVIWSHLYPDVSQAHRLRCGTWFLDATVDWVLGHRRNKTVTQVCTQTPNWTRLGETWRLSCPQWSQYFWCLLLWSNIKTQFFFLLLWLVPSQLKKCGKTEDCLKVHHIQDQDGQLKAGK